MADGTQSRSFSADNIDGSAPAPERLMLQSAPTSSDIRPFSVDGRARNAVEARRAIDAQAHLPKRRRIARRAVGSRAPPARAVENVPKMAKSERIPVERGQATQRVTSAGARADAFRTASCVGTEGGSAEVGEAFATHVGPGGIATQCIWRHRLAGLHGVAARAVARRRRDAPQLFHRFRKRRVAREGREALEDLVARRFEDASVEPG